MTEISQAQLRRSRMAQWELHSAYRRARVDRRAQELSRIEEAYVVWDGLQFGAILAQDYPGIGLVVPAIVGVWCEGVEQSAYRTEVRKP